MPLKPRDSAPQPAPVRRRHRPPWLGSLLLILVPAAVVLASLWAAYGWLIGTTAGLRTLLHAGALVVPSLSATGVDGSVRDGFRFATLTIDEPGWGLTATDVAVIPNELDWSRRLVDLARVSAKSAAVRWVADDSKTPPSAPPQSLALPLEVHLRDVRVDELQVGPKGEPPQVIRDIRLVVHGDRAAIRVEHASAQYGATQIEASGRVGASHPFPLDARGVLSTMLLERPLRLSITADGTLLDLRVVARSDGEAARVQANAQLTPFAPVPLTGLSVSIADLEPAQWVAEVPAMRLSGSAELKSQAAPDGGLILTGPFDLSNGLPGPVDRGRVPVQAARGSLRWSAQALEVIVDPLDAAGGTVQATVVRRVDSTLEISGKFRGVDAARVHTALTTTQAAGQFDYRLADGVQRISGRASNAKGVPLNVDFAIALANQVLDIDKAVVRIGEGRANVTGRVELGQRTTARLRGEFEALDLSQVVAGFKTRLNGQLLVDGSLQPPRRGRAQVSLTDSELYGRALAGQVDLKLDGDQFDVDAALRSDTAHLTVKGGLGGGRELAFELEAPRLETLAPTLGGSITAHGTVSGTLDSPAVAATASARELVLPNRHRIAKVDAQVRAAAAADAPLDVQIALEGHRAPDQPGLSIASANAVARGTTAAHRIELDATTATRQPVALRASGGWQQDAWRGTLTAASAGKPLNLNLDAPAPVLISAERMQFGPTALTARDTHFRDVEFAQSEGRWRSSGTFTNLQPQAFDSRARAPRRAVRTTAVDPQPLTLAGRWSLEYGDALNGIVVVERTGGDLYGGVDALHPIGISDIGAALSIVDNRVTGTAYLRGRALGEVDAVIDAFVDPEALQLAQQRRFRVAIDATLPDLGWVGPLIGDAVQVEGALTVKAAVGGTPAEPTADGALVGRALRLVWIEHGLRLENGTLNAQLEDGVLVIDDMTFTGDARVPPDEKRALGALKVETPGRVRIVGRVALQTLTGSIGVRAENLPILQRRDRWMVVSGDGGITLTPERAELYAKAVVDGAYIDFSSLRGPRTLPSDVVVVRPEDAEQKKQAAAPPLDVFLDVEGRLGQRFYIRGAGLEARLAGSVAVRGRPSQLTATGTVRIVDGIYNGYGQRLQIERGVVTFSGPLENPALNVLAVRSGLPVEVGVQIGGTALAPVVRLYSDTAMPDVEKLNWLVLGRAPGAGEGQDRALLTAAAGALFSGQSDGTTSNLMRSLGIDEFGIRSGGAGGTSLLPRETVAGSLRSGTTSTAAGDFVALGKRINDDLYVTFEQAISGAAYYVALNYQLTRRLSVILRSGSTNALDLVYSIAFD